MTEEAQRIAAAEVCGYQEITFSPLLGFHQQKSDERAKECGGRWRFAIPNYPSDLNAMHEAEKVLNQEQRVGYMNMLGRVCGTQHEKPFATAAQRLEAFLRTLKKWDDSK